VCEGVPTETMFFFVDLLIEEGELLLITSEKDGVIWSLSCWSRREITTQI